MISRLEGDLRTLITRWDRFFAGELRVPPTREKEILGRRVRELAERSSGEHSGDRFRVEQLQHRFMTYAVNWERLLREREEGIRRYIPGKKTETEMPGARRPEPTEPNVQPAPSVNTHGVGGLFERWCELKAEIGQDVKIGRQAFENQIKRQRSDIETRMGSKVTFEVALADGKVKLTARRVESNGKEE